MATSAHFVPVQPPRTADWMPGWRGLFGERLRNTVYGWIEPEDEARPKLPGYRIGGGIWRVRRVDLEAFVAAGRNVPEAAPEVIHVVP